MRRPILALSLIFLSAGGALAQVNGDGPRARARHGSAATPPPASSPDTQGCPGGSFSVTTSPDGGAVSVIFDNFTVGEPPAAPLSVQRKTCSLSIPLNLPEGYSLGVYRVDYRGFSHLGAGRMAQLTVDYSLGPKANGRTFRRDLKGASDTDFVFTERLGAGLMKRVGCGSNAVLDLRAALELQPAKRDGEAMVSLDTIDAAQQGGVTFAFDLKKCQP